MTSYTVKQLAKVSGVSVRALHHYDEIGLLKPAHIGANGYRYYGREELLRLQQILFHREVGFSLEEIRNVLDALTFDRSAALRSHGQEHGLWFVDVDLVARFEHVASGNAFLGQVIS